MGVANCTRLRVLCFESEKAFTSIVQNKLPNDPRCCCDWYLMFSRYKRSTSLSSDKFAVEIKFRLSDSSPRLGKGVAAWFM